MKLQQIRRAVEEVLSDPAFSVEDIDGFINESVKMAGELVNIPSLKVRTTVTANAGDYSVSLASLNGGRVFSGRLRRAYTSDGRLTIKANLEELTDLDPDLDDEGTISDVALEGDTLWLYKVPTEATTITVIAYVDPPDLVEDDDTPSDFPAELHRRLFVYGAAYIAYSEAENGLEDRRVNTNTFFAHSFDDGDRNSGITKLREWAAKRRSNQITSVWRY